MEHSEGISLGELARQALAEMIHNGKLSGGDLIKLLAMEEGRGEGGIPLGDFTIRLVEE